MTRSIWRTLFGTWFGRFLLIVGAIISYLVKGIFDNWVIGFANDQLLKIMKPFLPESFMAVGSWFWSLLIVTLLLAATVWATRKYGHVFSEPVPTLQLASEQKSFTELTALPPMVPAPKWLTPYEVVRYIVDASEWGKGLEAYQAAEAAKGGTEVAPQVLAFQALTAQLEVGAIAAHGLRGSKTDHERIHSTYWNVGQLELRAALQPGKCPTRSKNENARIQLYDDVIFAPDEVRIVWPPRKAESATSSLPLDASSLYAYVNGRARVRTLDQRIANSLGKAQVVDGTIGFQTHQTLAKFGISTIEQLDQLLAAKGDLIVKIAPYAPPQGDVPKGHSLLVLMWVLGAEMGVNAYTDIDGDRGWAEEMVKAYGQITRYP